MSSDSDKPQKPLDASAINAVDPYTEFLDLPPGSRPPHLYQLLELELFCPHPEQIEHAVRRQFRKVKPFEEHSDRRTRERIQDIMTHIARARVILTQPEHKQHYDEMLAKHLKVDRDRIIASRTAARIPEYRLTVIAGPARVGTKLELLPDRIIAVGAKPHCDLVLPSTRMRDVHAQLESVGQDWVLETLSPRDVTLVNDARVQKQPLNEQDVIEMGGFKVRFERIDARRPDPGSVPPPLVMVIREGPSIPEGNFSALPPASVLMGSDATALWQLTGTGVAVHHARIETDGALWEIRDLQSGSGTWINGERIDHVLLTDRDLLTIGPFIIHIGLRR